MRYGPADRASPFAVDADEATDASELFAMLKMEGHGKYKSLANTLFDVEIGLQSADAEQERRRSILNHLANASSITQGHYSPPQPTQFYDAINANPDANFAKQNLKSAAGWGLLAGEGFARGQALVRIGDLLLDGAPALGRGLAKRAVGAAVPALGAGLLAKDLYNVGRWYFSDPDPESEK